MKIVSSLLNQQISELALSKQDFEHVSTLLSRFTCNKFLLVSCGFSLPPLANAQQSATCGPAHALAPLDEFLEFPF